MNKITKITDNYIEYEDGARYNIIPTLWQKIADAPGIRDFMIKHNVLILDTPNCKHKICTINGQDFLCIDGKSKPSALSFYKYEEDEKAGCTAEEITKMFDEFAKYYVTLGEKMI